MSLKFCWIQPLVSMVTDRVMMEKKRCLHFFWAVFHLFFFILAGNNDMHEGSDKFEYGLIGSLTAELAALERLKKSP